MAAGTAGDAEVHAEVVAAVDVAVDIGDTHPTDTGSDNYDCQTRRCFPLYCNNTLIYITNKDCAGKNCKLTRSILQTFLERTKYCLLVHYTMRLLIIFGGRSGRRCESVLILWWWVLVSHTVPVHCLSGGLRRRSF